MSRPCDNHATIGEQSRRRAVSSTPDVSRGIHSCGLRWPAQAWGLAMNNIIYIIGLIVVVLAILSFLGLR